MTDMKWGFNLEELEKNNAHSIQGKQGLRLIAVFISWQPIKVSSVYMYCVPFLAIRGPRLASSILFQSSGMTNGIIEEKDIPEELPKQKERKKEEGEDYENMDSDQESVNEEVDVSMLSKLFKLKFSNIIM